MDNVQVIDSAADQSDRIAELVAEVFFYWFHRFPGVRFSASGTCTEYRTGLPHPMANCVLGCAFDEELARAKVHEICEASAELRAPFWWFLGTDHEKTVQRPLLEAAGFELHITSPAMVRDLEDIPGYPIQQVREVITESDLTIWTDLLQRIFGLDDAMGRFFATPFEQIGMGADQPLRALIILDESNRPVAITAVYARGTISGIYALGTLAEERGKGYGSLATIASMAVAAAMGATTVTLQSSPMGLPVYEKLGFKTVGTHERWLKRVSP